MVVLKKNGGATPSTTIVVLHLQWPFGTSQNLFIRPFWTTKQSQSLKKKLSAGLFLFSEHHCSFWNPNDATP